MFTASLTVMLALFTGVTVGAANAARGSWHDGPMPSTPPKAVESRRARRRRHLCRHSSADHRLARCPDVGRIQGALGKRRGNHQLGDRKDRQVISPRTTRHRDAQGAGLIALPWAVLAFLAFVMLTVQVAAYLYSASVLTAIGHDATRRAALAGASTSGRH